MTQRTSSDLIRLAEIECLIKKQEDYHREFLRRHFDTDRPLIVASTHQSPLMEKAIVELGNVPGVQLQRTTHLPPGSIYRMEALPDLFPASGRTLDEDKEDKP